MSDPSVHLFFAPQPPRFLVLLVTVLFSFFLIAPIARASGAERTAEPGQLVERDGRFFVSGEAAPFTGVVRERDETGATRTERTFNAGKTVSLKQWYKNGKPAGETVMTATGLSRKIWYENGNLEQESEIVSEAGTKVSEKSKMYYEDGKPKLEIGYRRDALHGPLREYDPSGQLLRDETYDQGKLTHKTK